MVSGMVLVILGVRLILRYDQHCLIHSGLTARQTIPVRRALAGKQGHTLATLRGGFAFHLIIFVFSQTPQLT